MKVGMNLVLWIPPVTPEFDPVLRTVKHWGYEDVYRLFRGGLK